MNKLFLILVVAFVAFAGNTKTCFKYDAPFSDDPTFVRSFISGTMIRNTNLMVNDIDTLFGRVTTGSFSSMSVSGNMSVTGNDTVKGDLIFSSAGSGLPMASFWGNEIAWAQASAAQGTWYRINDVDIDTACAPNLFTQNDSGQVTATLAGKYLINWGITLENAGASKHINGGIARNDTVLSAGQSHFESVVNTEGHLSGTAIVYVQAGGKIQLYVKTTDTGTPTITVDDINLSISMVGR